MLKGIKELIGQKLSMMEAADLLLEGMPGGPIDDSIVLAEEDEMEPETSETEPTTEEGEEDVGGGGGDPTSDIEEVGEGEPELPEDPTPANEPMEHDDVLDSPMPLPGDDLPEPVGAQTGEPINDNNDILSTEIDLGSNTMKDTLPVPPGGAIDAINSDDIMNQRVDSGFGDEEPTPEPPTNDTLLDEPAGVEEPVPPVPPTSDITDELSDGSGEVPPAPAKDVMDDVVEGDSTDKPEPKVEEPEEPTAVEEPTNESCDSFRIFGSNWAQRFSEAITLGNPASGDDPNAASGTADQTTTNSATGDQPAEDILNSSPDDSSSGGDSGDASSDAGGDNTVTAAVKDKVAEADMAGGDGTPTSKDDLLKKLGNITKSLEDAKKAIMNTIQ